MIEMQIAASGHDTENHETTVEIYESTSRLLSICSKRRGAKARTNDKALALSIPHNIFLPQRNLKKSHY